MLDEGLFASEIMAISAFIGRPMNKTAVRAYYAKLKTLTVEELSQACEKVYQSWTGFNMPTAEQLYEFARGDAAHRTAAYQLAQPENYPALPHAEVALNAKWEPWMGDLNQWHLNRLKCAADVATYLDKPQDMAKVIQQAKELGFDVDEVVAGFRGKHAAA